MASASQLLPPGFSPARSSDVEHSAKKQRRSSALALSPEKIKRSIDFTSASNTTPTRRWSLFSKQMSSFDSPDHSPKRDSLRDTGFDDGLLGDLPPLPTELFNSRSSAFPSFSPPITPYFPPSAFSPPATPFLPLSAFSPASSRTSFSSSSSSSAFGSPFLSPSSSLSISGNQTPSALAEDDEEFENADSPVATQRRTHAFEPKTPYRSIDKSVEKRKLAGMDFSEGDKEKLAYKKSVEALRQELVIEKETYTHVGSGAHMDAFTYVDEKGSTKVIKTWHNNIIDRYSGNCLEEAMRNGMKRYNICRELGIEVASTQFHSIDDKLVGYLQDFIPEKYPKGTALPKKALEALGNVMITTYKNKPLHLDINPGNFRHRGNPDVPVLLDTQVNLAFEGRDWASARKCIIGDFKTAIKEWDREHPGTMTELKNYLMQQNAVALYNILFTD